MKKLRAMTSNSSNPVNSVQPKKWIECFSNLLNVNDLERMKIES